MEYGLEHTGKYYPLLFKSNNMMHNQVNNCTGIQTFINRNRNLYKVQLDLRRLNIKKQNSYLIR